MPDRPSASYRDARVWKRILWILLFAVIYCVAEVVIFAVVIVQFGFIVLAGQRSQQLLEFAESLSAFIYAILRFVMFCSDEKPFPFADWPDPKTPFSS